MNIFEHRILRIERTAVQMCTRKSTDFASRLKIVGENREEMGSFLVPQDVAHEGFC